MNTQNEFGKDAGRYVYRTHEVGAAPTGDPPRAPGGSQVSVTDLKTGVTKNLAERNDWERFDGIVWTPWGTILAAEETITARPPATRRCRRPAAGSSTSCSSTSDDPASSTPRVSRSRPGDGTTDTVQDGIRARPALGAKSHEGMRFDKRGYLYGIAESRGQTHGRPVGRHLPLRPRPQGRPLERAALRRSRTDDRRYGEGRGSTSTAAPVQVDADREAERKGANEYQRPEDVETGESTGKDRNNGGSTLYVAITEGAEMRRARGRRATRASGRSPTRTSGRTPATRPPGLHEPGQPRARPQGQPRDHRGPAGEPSAGRRHLDRRRRRGTDDDDDDGGADHAPARTVQRFASMKDCVAEPTGIYFALEGTERCSAPRTPRPSTRQLVNDETLFVNRQHAGETSPVDQLVAIAPEDEEDDDEDEDG